LFTLVVPETATDEHLQLLAAVVERFNDTDTVSTLRDAQKPDDLYRLFIKGF
jgi:PTS system nitrogen regulatory IIA component